MCKLCGNHFRNARILWLLLSMLLSLSVISCGQTENIEKTWKQPSTIDYGIGAPLYVKIFGQVPTKLQGPVPVRIQVGQTKTPGKNLSPAECLSLVDYSKVNFILIDQWSKTYKKSLEYIKVIWREDSIVLRTPGLYEMVIPAQQLRGNCKTKPSEDRDDRGTD